MPPVAQPGSTVPARRGSASTGGCVSARCGSAGGERGSATVWMLALCLLLGVGVVAVGGLVSVLSARARAAATADLAALAAAGRVLPGGVLPGGQGEAAPCAAAARVARAAGARMVVCTLAGPVAEVTVELDLPGRFRRLPPTRARARAGPHWTDSADGAPGSAELAPAVAWTGGRGW